jgi:hypothetical protein
MPVLLLMAGLILPSTTLDPVPCTIVGDIVPTTMVRAADAIVRVVAVEYSKPPSHPAALSTGAPDSVIRFRIVEVLRGNFLSPALNYLGTSVMPTILMTTCLRIRSFVLEAGVEVVLRTRIGGVPSFC